MVSIQSEVVVPPFLVVGSVVVLDRTSSSAESIESQFIKVKRTSAAKITLDRNILLTVLINLGCASSSPSCAVVAIIVVVVAAAAVFVEQEKGHE